MESPTDSIKKIMNHLKQKFNQENKTESIHSLPSLKESALENYFDSNIFFNLDKMNPRIRQKDLNNYKKDPEEIPPKISTLRKNSFNSKIKEEKKANFLENPFKSSKSSSKINLQVSSRPSRPSKFGDFPKITCSKSQEVLKKPLGSMSPNLRKKKQPVKKTLFDVLSNFYLTKKFINTLKSLTSMRSPKFLSKNHFNIINDLVFFFDVWKQNELDSEINTENKAKTFQNKRAKTIFVEKLQKKVHKFSTRIKTFDNSSSFMIFWSLLHLMLILFYFVIIPLEISFQVNIQDEFELIYYVENVAAYFFLTDILVNCNTAVYLKGKLVKERDKIVKNYVKNYLLKDVLSIISIFLQVYQHTNFFDSFLLMTFLKMLFFLRMINFSAIIKRLEEMLFIDKSIHNVLSLLNLIFRIILLSHIFACLWFYIGTIHEQNSWLSDYDLTRESLWTKYLFSYYFVCITMNTVGYGDVTPRNSLEKIFTIVFIYIACGIFAYSINSIGVIVNEIAKKEHEFQNDLNILNEFMKRKRINFDLRMRVRKYLEYIWYEEEVEKLGEQAQIIEKLSDSLKEELLLEANGPIVRDLKLFTLNFSEELLRSTIPLLKEVRFTPGDIIFMKGDHENPALYIIRKGKVQIFLENHKMNAPVTVLNNLQRGESFGEVSFFSDKERSACARSIDFTTAFMIKKQDFFDLLVKFPKDYQRFCEIKDNLNLYEDYQDLHIKCYSCKSSSHMIQQCTNLNYKPLKDILLRKHFVSFDQTRQVFNRKIRKNFHATSFQNVVEKKAFQIQTEMFPSHLTMADSSYENEEFSDLDEEIIENSLDEEGKSNDDKEINEEKIDRIEEKSQENDSDFDMILLRKDKNIPERSQKNEGLNANDRENSGENDKNNNKDIREKNKTTTESSKDNNKENNAKSRDNSTKRKTLNIFSANMTNKVSKSNQSQNILKENSSEGYEKKESFKETSFPGKNPDFSLQSFQDFYEKTDNSKEFSGNFNSDMLLDRPSKRKINRKATKKNKYIRGSTQQEKKHSKIIENIEAEIINALFMDASSSSLNGGGSTNRLMNSSIDMKSEPVNNEPHAVAEKLKLKSLLNFIAELKENRKSEVMANKKKKNEENNEKINDFLVSTDSIKSWEIYFAHNNCEKIIEQYNKRALKKCRMKRSTTNIMSPDKFLQGRRQGFVEKSMGNLEKLGTPKQNSVSIVKKNFFQSSHMMEKFIKESQFDYESFKKQYKEKYEKNRCFCDCLQVFRWVCKWLRMLRNRKKKFSDILKIKNPKKSVFHIKANKV